MPLEKRGLTKLTEELGELVQIAAKKSAYMQTDNHPDGKGSMKIRMEQEIADVTAAISIVITNFDLDNIAISNRTADKLRLFMMWDKTEIDKCGSSCTTQNEYEIVKCILPLGHFGSCQGSN